MAAPQTKLFISGVELPLSKKQWAAITVRHWGGGDRSISPIFVNSKRVGQHWSITDDTGYIYAAGMVGGGGLLELYDFDLAVGVDA